MQFFKQIFISYYLGIMLLSMSFLPCEAMQIDVTDGDYVARKNKLLEAVKDNSLGKTKKAFEEVMGWLNNKFRPNISYPIKEAYLNDLLTPPETNPIIKAALANQNVSILYFLLRSNDIGFDGIKNYLEGNLIIDPTQDESYIKSKEALLAAIEKNTSLTIIKKLFDEVLDKLHEHFAPNSYIWDNPLPDEYYGKNIKPQYLKDLIKTTINSALTTQSLDLLFFLLSKDGREAQFADFATTNLLPFVKPNADRSYVKLKNKLLDAIKNNETDNAKIIIEQLQNAVKKKFISDDNPPYSVSDYFNDKIWPVYLDDLINNAEAQENAATLALDKQDFAVLFYLLKYQHNYKTLEKYLGYLKKYPLNPSNDNMYKKLQDELINAVNNNETNNVQELLTCFKRELENKFIPNELSEDAVKRHGDLTEINDYYNYTLYPVYLHNLLLTVLPIAITNNRLAIIYIILHEIQTLDRTVPRQFNKNLLEKFEIQSFIENLPEFDKLIQINNQAIVNAVDAMTINCLKLLLKNSTSLINFLNTLTSKGYGRDRLEKNLMKAFAAQGKYTEYILNQLNQHDFLKNIKVFNTSYHNYSLFLVKIRSIVLLNPNTILNTINNELSEDEVNEKDIPGDSFLMHLIHHAHNKLRINLIKVFLDNKNPDVNQPGGGGLTPLMAAAKIELSEDITADVVSAVIQLLLDKGADPDARDIFGKTALDYAQEGKNKEIINLLALHTKVQPIILTIAEQHLALHNLHGTLYALANKVQS